MTYHSRLSHSLLLATPLLMATGLLVAVLWAGAAMRERMATIGDGIDEFSLRAGGILDTVIPSDTQGWLASVAIFVAAWLIIATIRKLRGPVGGSGDAGALTSYTVRRTLVSLGLRQAATAWGTVRDSKNAQPLPLATVRLVSSDGAVMDSCVADQNGRYGFRMAYDEVLSRGYRARLEVRKSGYYPRSAPREVPLSAGMYAGADLAMDRVRALPSATSAHSGPAARIAGTAAFWVGVVAVPMRFVSDSSLPNALILGVFLAATIVRATWLRHA